MECAFLKYESSNGTLIGTRCAPPQRVAASLIDNSCAVRIPFDDSYFGMSLFITRLKVIECAFLKYESSNGMCVH